MRSLYRFHFKPLIVLLMLIPVVACASESELNIKIEKCNSGVPDSCLELAFEYGGVSHSLGVSEDQDQALKYATKACSLGESSGCALEKSNRLARTEPDYTFSENEYKKAKKLFDKYGNTKNEKKLNDLVGYCSTLYVALQAVRKDMGQISESQFVSYKHICSPGQRRQYEIQAEKNMEGIKLRP